ncbi:MAG: Fe/S biogenesis protein NfuA [Bacteroidia bacterium]|nr:Fe/S biogenesis protein NfuA [Bacteroidia bacterium]
MNTTLTLKRPVTIYAESTPNPNAMKFVANIGLLKDVSVEYTSKAQAKGSPLAQSLFDFPFVAGVFIAANFVSVTKNNSTEWDTVILELRSFIREFLVNGGEAVTELPEKKEEITVAKTEAATTAASKANPVIDGKIIAILEQYVRPAVEGDGGNIEFKSFEDGKVKVVLQGACSGCPSSTITLKAGIEALLKKMIPEVQEVVAVTE